MEYTYVCRTDNRIKDGTKENAVEIRRLNRDTKERQEAVT